MLLNEIFVFFILYQFYKFFQQKNITLSLNDSRECYILMGENGITQNSVILAVDHDLLDLQNPLFELTQLGVEHLTYSFHLYFLYLLLFYFCLGQFSLNIA